MVMKISIVGALLIYLITEIFYILKEQEKNRDPIDKYHRHKKKLRQHRIHKLRSLPYQEYLRSDHWKLLRRAILFRDRYKCRDCKSGYSLQVHHLTYVRRGYENLEDLITLCDTCHEQRHF